MKLTAHEKEQAVRFVRLFLLQLVPVLLVYKGPVDVKVLVSLFLPAVEVAYKELTQSPSPSSDVQTPHP